MSKSGIPPHFKVYDAETGNLLWDTINQWDEWMKREGRHMLAAPNVPAAVKKPVIPPSLDAMNRPQLNTLIEELGLRKLPPNWTNEEVKRFLLPHLGKEMLEEAQKTIPPEE